ncbi:MAG: alpha-L-fucosidase [Lachnospiraceae bacterium]
MELKIEEGKFNASPESLMQYECPEWFKDAKFGIWSHWGPQCGPRFGDWYARNMYIEGHPQYEYHCEHFGHPSKVGYKDIIPLWKAENFEPDKLMDLYKRMGAKYFVSLASHHDNFDCWDSKYHKWNSVNMGPKKDIVGMWKEAANKAGLPFGVTVHHERSYSWFSTNKGCDTKGEYEGVPYDGNLSEYADLYYEKHDDTNFGYPINPSYSFVKGWYDRVTDLITNYDPDLFYSDGSIPFDVVGRSAIANYYNHNMKVNNGELRAVYNLKNLKKRSAETGRYYGDYYEGCGVQDIERGVVKDINPRPWQTDTCIGGWFFKEGREYKTATEVIKLLVDIVSKNGNLLLNFPLRPDGTLEDEEIKTAEGIAAWMDVNGEAIFGTRPFTHFGEGGETLAGGEFNENEITYNAHDFRFTTKPDCVYAICLGWPEDGQFEVKSFGSAVYEKAIKKVEILGCDETLTWEVLEDKLVVKAPQVKPCDTAYTIKISV